MKEIIYIQSQNLDCIRHLIDHSLLTDLYRISGISTYNKICVNDILKTNTSIILFDESINEKDSLESIKKLTEINNNIVLICISEELDYNIHEILKYFSDKKIFIHKGIYIDLIALIIKINNLRNKRNVYDSSIKIHLSLLSIKEHLKGYTYLKYAIFLKINDSQMKMSTLCDKIAREYNVTSSRVERCMRTSICKGYKENQSAYNNLYGFEHKPGCMQLISKLVEIIR